MQLQSDYKSLSAYHQAKNLLIQGLNPINEVTAEAIEPHLKIMDKSDTLIPFVPNAIQAHFSANRTRRDIVLKSRQVGFTTHCRKEDFVLSQVEASRQLVIADKAKNTAKLRVMNDRFYDNLPERYKLGRKLNNASTTSYANGSEVSIDTAGGDTAGRASTFTRLHASEVAFWKNAHDIMTGIMNTLPLNGYAVAESTPNGAVGWFYETFMAALDGDSVWTPHFYEWWWHDENRLSQAQLIEFNLDILIYPYTDEEQELIAKHGLTQDQIYWRRYKIKEDSFKFAQEHPEDAYQCFLASGNSYFGDIEKSYTAYDGKTYDDTHQYVAGGDFGQTTDFTVIIVIDTYDNSMVDMLRINQLDWETMRYRIKQMCDKWQCPLLAEWNSFGNPNIEALQKVGVRAIPFNTTSQSKPLLMQSLHAGLHEQGLTLLDNAVLKHELRSFVAMQSPTTGHWRFEASEGAHDDCVIALALAWWYNMRGFTTIEAL